MVSNDNYYLDDLLEEFRLYLPRVNIREIYNICWSINKVELYKCTRRELFAQLCIEALSIHSDSNRICNTNIELMYNLGQIDDELIGKHCNQLIQMQMISVESDANGRIRDKCIDFVIVSETFGKLVINHGNDMLFSNGGIHRTQLVYSLLKHFVEEEFIIQVRKCGF